MKGVLRSREIEPDATSHRELQERFTWQVPHLFNIAWATCDRHGSDPLRGGNTALLFEHHSGLTEKYTFAQLKNASDRLALALAANGIEAGERVAVLLPQRPEAALAHLAAYKLGALAVPLTTLFQSEALLFRLRDSGAKAIILEEASLELVESLLPQLPDLCLLLVVGQRLERPLPVSHGRCDMLGFEQALGQAQGAFRAVTTSANDPALIIYTSGTTGNPKGALHAHRVLLGHLPGFELSHDFCPQTGDGFYTPAEWAWIGGLLDVLLPAWYHGLPVLAYQGQGAFDPERCLALLAKYRIRNSFIPPTALRMIAQVPRVAERYRLTLRTLMSGGEALGAGTLRWAEENLGVKVNEIYGQTEVNYLVGNCASVWPIRPGSMGLPYPGHRVTLLDDAGREVAPGQVGEVAVHRGEKQPDPVFFLEYWQNKKATEEKFSGPWALTGDLAALDAQGYLWFKGRKDDVIISAGHRIGPVEIEGVLQKHPAVALSAAVAKPDALRGSIVKAFIKLSPGFTPGEALVQELQDHVKNQLAKHEYPREIEFRDEFPLTPTGKIRRVDLRALEAERFRQGNANDS